TNADVDDQQGLSLELHDDANLFLRFPAGAVSWVLAAAQEATRHAPPVAVGLADEQDGAVVAFDDAHGPHAERGRTQVDEGAPDAPTQAAETLQEQGVNPAEDAPHPSA